MKRFRSSIIDRWPLTIDRWPFTTHNSPFTIHHFRLSLTALLLAFVLLASLSAPVLAHGGGVSQLAAAEAGSYALYAWTNPDPARVGTLHVTVALAEPETDAPVLGADVTVRATPLAGSGQAMPIVTKATHADAANKTTYEADLQLPSEGAWQVTIAYQTPEATGSADFDLDVEPRSETNWLLIGGGVLMVAAGLWMITRPRRMAKKQQERMGESADERMSE